MQRVETWRVVLQCRFGNETRLKVRRCTLQQYLTVYIPAYDNVSETRGTKKSVCWEDTGPTNELRMKLLYFTALLLSKNNCMRLFVHQSVNDYYYLRILMSTFATKIYLINTSISVVISKRIVSDMFYFKYIGYIIL